MKLRAFQRAAYHLRYILVGPVDLLSREKTGDITCHRRQHRFPFGRLNIRGLWMRTNCIYVPPTCEEI